MNKRTFLAIAIPALFFSFGALAADKLNDQSSDRGESNGGTTAQAGEIGMGFGELDKDGDGKLSWAEANMDPSVTARFPEYDRDADGFIASSEFSAIGAGPGGGQSDSDTPSGPANGGGRSGASK